MFFDLDGFKDYNDAFGHPAGDALLRRLAPALAAVGGRAYRLGGDEFCLLLDGELGDDDPLVARAVARAQRARRRVLDRRRPTASSCSPRTRADATEALRLADERMYARKRRRRGGSRGQARDLLVQVMAERTAERERRRRARDGRRPRARAGRGGPGRAHRAAELHDVGKVAVPDAILDKRGPLDADEWEIMRQHTIAGERILGAAETCARSPALVRAAHERWDGGGYPDGLRGEEIPLGARIICACDAFDAMLRARPHRAALSPAAALAELRRCAGTQFDPRVARKP